MSDDKIEINYTSMKEALRDINLKQKETFREYLRDSIKEENIIDFKNIVSIIGEQWGVKRTVPNDVFYNKDNSNDEYTFIGFMFKNMIKNCLELKKEKIPFGRQKKTGEERSSVESYASKLYFLFNPEEHKVIYDSHNRNAVAKILKDDSINTCSLEYWTELINKNYDALKTDCKGKWGEELFTKYNPFDVVDCYLWIKGNPDFQKSK